jgi:hypothetical protein
VITLIDEINQNAWVGTGLNQIIVLRVLLISVNVKDWYYEAGQIRTRVLK